LENHYDISSMNNLGNTNTENDDFVAVMNDLNDDLLRTRLD
jgi:hypothetical protein